MRVCIIGAGLSGLSAAHYLAQHADSTITIYEQSEVLGGRANVIDGAEHCARLFLDDYTHLLAILDAIPTADGRSVHDTLQAVTRYWHSASAGWVEISHSHPVLAKEVPWRDKLQLMRERSRSPLLAQQDAGVSSNCYGSRKNHSLSSIAHVAANLLRTRTAYALPGSTDGCLIDPWARYLRDRGVAIETGTQVQAIAAAARAVAVTTAAGRQEFDAVIVSAFVSDLIALLSASGLAHTLRAMPHTHRRVFSVTLHGAEPILAGGQPAIYSRAGIAVVVQPQHRRCVVLCLRPISTDEGYVLARAREMLGLEYPLVDVRVRDNQRAAEALFVADQMDPSTVLARPLDHVYFAGSCMRNSYPADSGEGAARSAFNAVRALRRSYEL